jgi:fumarylacetoacetate (FAA) hydrolase family protein
VPGDDVRLRPGDEVEVASPLLGRLVNHVDV